MRTTTLTLVAFQGEAGSAVQGVDQLHEGGAGDVRHTGQVSEGGDQVGETSIQKLSCEQQHSYQKRQFQ